MFKLAGGSVIAQAVAILVSPVLARLYTPEVFGLAAIFTTITSIIGVIACLRYDLAILLPKDDGDAANVLSTSLLCAVFITIVSGLIFLFFHAHILSLLQAEKLAPYLLAIPVIVFFNAMFLALNNWNSRMKLFGRLAINRTAQAVGTSGSQLLLGLMGFVTAGSLIWSTAGGVVVGCSILAIMIWHEDGRFFRKTIGLKKIAESFKKYKKFPLIDSWGSLLNVVSRQMPLILLGVFFTGATVGHYALASRVIYLPMSMIGGAIGNVFFQRVAEAHSKEEDVGRLVKMVFRRLVMVALLPSLLIVFMGTDYFTFIFGSKWVEAGIFSRMLAAWMFVWFISSPLTILFVVYNRLESAFVVHVILLVVRTVPLIIGGIVGNAYLAIALFACSGILAYGGLLFWCSSLAGVSMLEQLRIIYQEALYVVPVVGAILLFKIGFGLSAGIVFFVSLFGMLAYGVLLVRRDPELLEYFNNIKQRIVKK